MTSVEEHVRRSFWTTVFFKVCGDTVASAAALTQSVAASVATVSNCLHTYRRTLLMVESHYANRYQDLTDRDLGYAAAEPHRHAMGPVSVMEAAKDDEGE